MDDDTPLAAEWTRVSERMRTMDARREIEIEQFRLMFFYGARVALLAISPPVNPTRALHRLYAELQAFDKEIAPHAKLPAAQRADEPIRQDQAPAA
jgi:hypothetical protein